MKLSIQEIVKVLQRYKSRYRWLDVFASEVQELTEPSNLKLKRISEDRYHLTVGSQPVELVLERSRNQARFRLIKEADITSGAALGAGIGVFIGAVTRSSPAGILLALLVGGIVGAGIATQQNEGELSVDENRILTLAYEPHTEEWQVYHGPYRDYAKVALHPSNV